MSNKERVYSDSEIEQRLKEELPNWYLENGWIRRKYKTGGWKGTLMLVNTVGHLAEAAWHHPDIAASQWFGHQQIPATRLQYAVLDLAECLTCSTTTPPLKIF